MPPRACACSLNMQQRSTCQLPGWTGRSALGLRPDLILLQYGLRSICRRFQQFQCLNKQYMTFHVIKIHAIVFVIFLLHSIEPIFWGQPSGPCVAMHVITCQCVVRQMRGERSVGGLHTCTHGAGPAAAGERANSTRRPAVCCARCDYAWGTTPQHSGGRSGLRALIQGTCSEHRLSCRCSHEGVGIPGWLWSSLGG